MIFMVFLKGNHGNHGTKGAMFFPPRSWPPRSEAAQMALRSFGRSEIWAAPQVERFERRAIQNIQNIQNIQSMSLYLEYS